jgi:hypothetical protein
VAGDEEQKDVVGLDLGAQLLEDGRQALDRHLTIAQHDDLGPMPIEASAGIGKGVAQILGIGDREVKLVFHIVVVIHTDGQDVEVRIAP